MARSADSEERILEAARSLFLEHGYSAVTTDLLSQEAKSSKTTIYRYFGDMAGVLEAVVKKEGDVFSVANTPPPESEAEFWAVVTDYGTQLLKLLNSRFCVQLDRTLHEEARRHPDIAAVFYDNAYGRGHRELTELISHGQKRGFVRGDISAAELADALLSVWEGLPYVRARLALTDKPFPQPRKRVMSTLRILFPDAAYS